jgi:hypothetical protein
MSWGAIEYEFTTSQRAFILYYKYGVQAKGVQKELIKKLNDHGITSEYENEVLNELKNYK